MRWRGAAVLAGLALTGPVLGGCAVDRAQAAGTTVVTSFYPLGYVAHRIAGGHATVVDLTHPGQEPHDLELSVRQTADVVDADVLFYERGFQPAVDRAVDEAVSETDDRAAGRRRGGVRGLQVVDAARTARLVGDDPHFWLDPTRLARVATAFERRLAAVDPGHATTYARRLAALRHDLARLDTSFRAGLRHCRIRTIVVSHDAFGYLGRRYGLQVLGINGLSPDAEPSPFHVREIQQVIDRRHITTVFSEELASRAFADSIAGDLGLRSAVLDPIEGLDAATAHQDYLSLMRRNLATLERANRC
jgi:zinc transport system substrate-binding protein